MVKEIKKYIINLCLIGFMLFFLIFYIVKTEGLTNINNTLSYIDYKFIFIAFIIMFIYWFLEAVILNLYSRKHQKKISIWVSFKTSMIGFFFSSITPFSSGGQPIQVYYMVKTGMRISDATSVLLSRFISYQISLSIFSLILLKYQFSFFEGGIDSFKILLFIGFFINIAVALFLILIAVSTSITKIIVRYILLFLYKIKIVKKFDVNLKKAYDEIDKLGNNIKDIKKDFKLIFIILTLTILQFAIYFSIPYFIYLSFGMTGHSIFVFIAAQAFVNLISAFVPLPGGSGGAEVSFVTFFTLLFNNDGVKFAMLIWRVITFYFTILVSSLFLRNVFSVKKEK